MKNATLAKKKMFNIDAFADSILLKNKYKKKYGHFDESEFEAVLPSKFDPFDDYDIVEHNNKLWKIHQSSLFDDAYECKSAYMDIREALRGRAKVSERLSSSCETKYSNIINLLVYNDKYAFVIAWRNKA